MTTRMPPIIAEPAPPEGVLYRLTADDFYRMIDSEIIPPGRRVGLWEGRLFEKMARKQAHAISHSKLARSLIVAVPEGWFVSPENPIEIAGDKVPLPDLAVIRGRPDDYPSRPPTAADVALIVELADSGVRKDLGAGLEAYARAGIPAYWVVRLDVCRVEVYTLPTVQDGKPRFGNLISFGIEDSVPLVLDGLEVARIPVREVLPERPA